MSDLLANLADRVAIEDLVARLGLWLDEQATGDASAIFTADASVKTPGGVAQGRDALVAQARRTHDVPTHHLITNVLVERAGDSAVVGANLLVAFADGAASEAAAPGMPAAGRILGERYRFEVARTPDGWRIARVETTVRWSTGGAASA